MLNLNAMKVTTIIIITALIPLTAAMPTMILRDSNEHCVYIEASEETMVRLHYEAEEALYDRNHPNYSPTHITIGVTPLHRVMDTKLHPAPVRHRLRPTNAMLEDPAGAIVHQFEMAGKGSVCVRSEKASPEKPYLFKFRIQSDSDEEPLAEEKESMGDFSEHLTHMEMELGRIEKGMHGVLKYADFLKEQDAAFHKHAQEMDSATLFWPIVQTCVLLMTGFTQARHIVEFFKSRRII